MSRSLLLGVATSFLLLTHAFAEDLDPVQPYRVERINPVEYQVDLTIAITAPHKTKNLQVWLPIPPSDNGQTYRRRALGSSPQIVEPKLGVEPTFGNQFAYFEFTKPQGAQLLRHQFTM